MVVACSVKLDAADRPLELHPGDHICYIGNTLADRMQHHARLETYIHALYPRHQLTFRNLGFSGDEVVTRPRSENFGSPDQWLEKCQADVVFCFFGYNEALRGQAALPEFKANLAEMIDSMLGQKYNGQSPPRIIVCSPIAHEDLHSPHLPVGSANNKRLALYTDAMKMVCAGKEVLFVDLFTPTRQRYLVVEKRLTMNGIHLLDHGNRVLAEMIINDLLPSASLLRLAQVSKLRAAVLEKNYYWFSRYRVVDGYNVFGGRSKLEWHDQSNADVMQREMEIFDVMIANRDLQVWAVARGEDLEVADDNIPELLEVKTNKPGPLAEGAFPYVGGEDAIGQMKVAAGMQVNLFASEDMFPRLINPVQMAVDTDSRLWVSVWPSYPHWNPTEPRCDALVILPDDDGDGVADDCLIFADELNSITGFEFWGGGVLVAAPPEIWFLQDTDGDDRADVKIRMLQGVSSADTHHSANAMLIGPDGWLYWSRGIFNVANFETPTNTYRSGTSGVHRFNPRTFEVEFHFPIGPNPHGDVFDQWGYQFACDGTSGTGSYVNIGKGTGNKQWYQKRVRPVSAIGILSSSHFPVSLQGNFLISNAIGFLGVLQHEVHYDGADITATEIEPIVVSSDPNFRPSDLEIGGDGAMYISDWHNVLIGHMQHNMRDPNRDHKHGRIYRVTYAGRPLLTPAKMKGQPILNVCKHFFAQENGTRYRARLELSGRETEKVVARVTDFAAGLNPRNAMPERDEGQALLECLWVFEEQRVPNIDLLKKVFQAAEPRVRAAAIRTLGHWAGKVADWEPTLIAASRDTSALVRAEAVKSATKLGGVDAEEVIFEVSRQPSDPELVSVLTYARSQIDLDAVVQDAVEAGRPLSPAAQEYAWRNARIENLLKMERTEALYRAILNRPDATTEQLSEALDGLALSTNSTSPALLLEWIEHGQLERHNLTGLGELLTRQSVADLRQVQDRIEAIATNGQSAEVRRLGYVAWITAVGPDDAFLAATQSTDRLKDFLDAVPSVDHAVRGALYAKVEPLIFELPAQLRTDADAAITSQHGIQVDFSGGRSLHDVAIGALASIPGHDTEMVHALASLVKAGRNRPAVFKALRGVPAESWPEQEIGPLVDNLVGFLSEIPAQFRTAGAASDAVELGKSLASLMPTHQAHTVLERLENLDVRVIAVGTVPHRMIFDKERIVVQAGKPVEFRFSNSDAMPHNFAITLPGALAEVGDLGEATGRDADAIERHYIPRSDKILLASQLLQPGQTQAVSFEVPDQPGVYPFVCTYPGHWRRMYGALHVVPDLEEYRAGPDAYLAALQLPIKDELLILNTRGRDWKFDELVAEVKELHHGRAFDVGQQLFKVASCAGCHQLNNEGRVFGPDLAKLDPKKRTTEHILRSILDPSKEIDPKFQTYVFEMESGKIVTGMIVEETPEELKVVVDPLAKDKPTVLAKDEIEDQVQSKISQMPVGLLNKLSREEILDLIAYVYAGGDKQSHLFSGHHH